MKNGKYKKGQILDIWGTFLIFITAAMIITTMIAVYFLAQLSDKTKIEIAVEKFVNKPYIVGELLSHQQMGDRQFLEHATEIVVAGGVENSKSSGISAGIDAFMQKLGFDDKTKYHIVIKDNQNSKYVEAGSKAENLKPSGSSGEVSNPTISNDAVIPLFYKNDTENPSGILGYIQIVTEGG